jgi:lactate dehydrogenase-like 2-hydroxyacid dehydrogenase
MTEKPGLLLFTPNMEGMAKPILDRFEPFRMWEQSDAMAALRSRGKSIVATLTTGHDPINAALIEMLPNLKVIAAVGAGFDGIDVAFAKKRGIKVANAGDTHSGDVADGAVAFTLGLVHRFRANHHWVLDGTWAEKGYPPLRPAMSEQRFGILGLGRIGHQIALRLEPFRGEIAWWGRSEQSVPWPKKESPLALAKWCTVLLVATRGDAAGLVDKAMISAIGPDGYIVNVSRGRVIDEDAMIAALREGRLAGAGLDVFATEPTPPERWAKLPNVILSPHTAGQTMAAMSRLSQAACRNLQVALDGGPVVNEITL